MSQYDHTKKRCSELYAEWEKLTEAAKAATTKKAINQLTKAADEVWHRYLSMLDTLDRIRPPTDFSIPKDREGRRALTMRLRRSSPRQSRD